MLMALLWRAVKNSPWVLRGWSGKGWDSGGWGEPGLSIPGVGHELPAGSYQNLPRPGGWSLCLAPGKEASLTLHPCQQGEAPMPGWSAIGLDFLILQTGLQAVGFPHGYLLSRAWVVGSLIRASPIHLLSLFVAFAGMPSPCPPMSPLAAFKNIRGACPDIFVLTLAPSSSYRHWYQGVFIVVLLT